MLKLKITILCLIILLSLSISCQRQQLSKEELLTTLDSLEHKLDWLDYKIALEYWDFYTTGKPDSLKFYQALYNFVLNDNDIFTKLRTGKRLLTDGNEKRRLELIYDSFLLGRIETNNEITHLRDSLSSININYRAELDGEKRTANYLYKTYRSDSNRSHREKAYRAWCAVGREMSDGLAHLFRIRNREAHRLGYNSYLGLVFKLMNIKSDEYLTLLERLDSLSEQPYLKILEKAGNKLNVNKIELWDLAYTYSDINKQIDWFFPVDSQLKYVKESLKGIGFNLDKLPIYFDLKPKEGKSQFAYAFTIKAPYDMRVLANLYDGLYSTRVLLHEIGHTLHSAFINQDNALFSDAAMLDGSWAEGMAQITTSLIDKENWLSKYANIPPRLVSQYLEAKKEQDIIYLRTTLLRLNFEYEAYLNPNRDLNKLYWELFERYLHLPRHENIYPWAAIIHYTTHPVYLQNYLFADIITAQTMNFIQNNYGDPVDNTMLKSFLVQNYYRFGTRYNWRDLLKRGTDEELNPDYLIKKLGI
ncbi:MAG: M3 family metallopeptidase [Candidatus Zixiibacteriota bacterium]